MDWTTVWMYTYGYVRSIRLIALLGGVLSLPSRIPHDHGNILLAKSGVGGVQQIPSESKLVARRHLHFCRFNEKDKLAVGDIVGRDKQVCAMRLDRERCTLAVWRKLLLVCDMVVPTRSIARNGERGRRSIRIFLQSACDRINHTI